VKILYVVHAYHPSIGGVQWLIRNLAERMVAGHGDQVEVLTTTAFNGHLFTDPGQPSMSPGVEQISGIRVRRFPVFNHLPWLRLAGARISSRLRLPGRDWLRGLYFGPLVPGLSSAIARSQADVVVSSSFPMIHMYTALRGAHRMGRPAVLIGTVHSTDPWCYDLPRMYRAINSADAYIALSTHEVVGAGVDVGEFAAAGVNAAALEFRRRQGFGEDPLVLVLGRQTVYKRPDIVLAAMQRVWPRIPTARLLFAGARADYSQDLETLLTALPAEQRARVTVISDFDESDKPAILNACSVLLQPSERESLGIVFLEAWAAGKPVIGARSGAAQAVIEPGRDGLLAAYEDAAEWAEAIHQLLTNAELRRQMGAAGRQKVKQHYAWEVIVPRTRKIFERLQ
jgi:glycosyltransferase involved in cell wall biosynthesis